MKSKFLAMMLFAGATVFGQVSLGIRIGPPPAPRVVRVHPVSPGVGYTWVDGYWYPQGNHYRWHDGYWTRSPYEGAHWVSPRYESGQFFEGRWEGQRGNYNHDHRWDRDRNNRDYNRYQDRRDDHRDERRDDHR